MFRPKWRGVLPLPLLFMTVLAAILMMGIVTAAPTAGKSTAVSLDDWSSKACQTCHPREWQEWSQSGHAMTLSAQLLNASHNSSELLDQTCVKCHSPELGTVKISDIVQPIDQKGPWKLVGQYANAGDTPSIPCLACHQSHTASLPGLLPGMDFGDESTFYRSVAPPQITNLYVYDAFAQKYIDPLPIAPVMNGDQAIPIADTRANRLCYTCHATERAESNLFEPGTPPLGDNSVGTGDDRTLMGVHQGIPCVTCHMPGGSHTFNPMSACSQCHSSGSTTAASLNYVTQVTTSYTDPTLSMLSGNASPLNIHWLDKTQLWPPLAVGMQATDSGDQVIYTITLRNFGSSDISNIDVRGTIPAGAGYLDSQIIDGNNPGRFDGSIVYFNIGALPSGQTFGPITYRVQKGTAKDLTAHASVSWEQPAPGSANSPNVAPH
ncbi:MAG: hypothetical protein M1570_11775 [Chloroflexi bacterium]|nr:hypothetical protein [Chloroflexota bacterium]